LHKKFLSFRCGNLEGFPKKMIIDLNLLFWIECLLVIVVNNQPILFTLLY